MSPQTLDARRSSRAWARRCESCSRRWGRFADLRSKLAQPSQNPAIGGEPAPREPPAEARRLQHDKRMIEHVFGRAPGIDFDDDGEQSGEHARLARGAQIEAPGAARSR